MQPFTNCVTDMSRKLDARVAEIMMGYVEDDRGYYLLGDKVMMTTESLPNYSTDMNAAMEMIDKLVKDWDFVITTWMSCNMMLSYKVVVATPDSEVEVIHKSLPEAICLAALRAKGDGEWIDKYLKEN